MKRRRVPRLERSARRRRHLPLIAALPRPRAVFSEAGFFGGWLPLVLARLFSGSYPTSITPFTAVVRFVALGLEARHGLRGSGDECRRG